MGERALQTGSKGSELSQVTEAALNGQLLAQAVHEAGIDTETQACLDDAFRTLEKLQVANSAADPRNVSTQKGAATADPQSSSSTVLDGSKEELQRRLVQSATIMRKLYTRNSALEGQLEGSQAAPSITKGTASSAPSAPVGGDGHSHQGTAHSLPTQDSILRPSTTPARGQIPTPISLLHQKDTVISQLQAALSSSQRQVGLLRAALERGDATNSSISKPCSRAANRSARQAEPASSNFRKVSKLDGRAPAATQRLLEAAQQRLTSEAAIHELELSACHARLLELERQQADWYVEKRLMQDEHRELQQQHSESQQQLQQLQTRLTSIGSDSVRCMEATGG